MRHIDDSKPLSDEDRQWLTDWCRFAEIDRIDAMHGEEPEEHPSALLDNLAPLQSGSDHSGEPEEPEDPLKSEPSTFTNLSEQSDEDEDEDEGDWYENEGVTNDDLRDELGRRELSKSGNKEELIARLREDDESDEDDADEDEDPDEE